MTLEQVMKMYGLNARGAAKKMKQLGIEEPQAEASASTDKWTAMVEKLKTYDGRFTKEGFPHTQDFEKCVGIDVTPDQVKKLWSKFKSEQD